jgi:hypothetical protein
LEGERSLWEVFYEQMFRRQEDLRSDRTDADLPGPCRMVAEACYARMMNEFPVTIPPAPRPLFR